MEVKMDSTKTRARRLLAVGVIGAVAGTVVNAGIYGIGRAADVAYVARQTSSGPDNILLVHVVSFSLMAFGVGLVAALIAARVGRPSLHALQVLGAVIAVASTSMDIGIDSTVAAKLSLATMHLVMGIAYVVSLRAAQSTRVRSLSAAPIVDTRVEALAV
jgi:uncharacterized protein DUF6069